MSQHGALPALRAADGQSVRPVRRSSGNSDELPFMSHYNASKWEAEWAAAATPRGTVVHVRVKLADASREGRAMVAGCGPQPAEPRVSTCSLSQGGPPVTSQSPAGRRQPPAASVASRRQSRAAAQETAEERAEIEQRQAIDRFWPFIWVAAVSAAPRSVSPDPFRLGRHLARDRRIEHPPLGPRCRRADNNDASTSLGEGAPTSFPPGRPPVPNGALRARTLS